MKIDTGKKGARDLRAWRGCIAVFSPDGKKLMWTSTRDGNQPSQLYMADFTAPEK